MENVLPGIVLAAPSSPQSSSEHRLFVASVEFGTVRYSRLVTAINLPGVFVEALISLPISWPDSWHPEGLTLDSWRAIILPFFCLPFWWFVGRGTDALLGRRRLHWVTLLLGSILCSCFIVMILGLRFGLPASDRTAESNWIFWGVGCWALAFGVFPLTWIWRGRSSRALKKADV
jgi:hypothetical protein